MFSFSPSITNLADYQDTSSVLWRLAEGYLNSGRTTYRISEIKGKKIFLESMPSKANFFITLLKILSYLTIFPVLCALGIRAWYRRPYSFKIISTQNPLCIYMKSKNNSSVTSDSTRSSKPVIPSPVVDPLIKTAYKLETIIDRLKQARKQGVQLGLIVGIEDNQPLPQANGWQWCSLGTTKIEQLSANRLHVVCTNFNNEKEMGKIQHLFDKVVVAPNMIQLFEQPWATLKGLLVEEPHAELCTESWGGIIEVLPLDLDALPPPPIYNVEKGLLKVSEEEDDRSYQREVLYAYVKWEKQVGKQEADFRYDQYLANISKAERMLYSEEELAHKFIQSIVKQKNLIPQKIDHVAIFLKHLKVYLLKHFTKVELKKGAYPYTHGGKVVTDYWVARGPK